MKKCFLIRNCMSLVMLVFLSCDKGALDATEYLRMVQNHRSCNYVLNAEGCSLKIFVKPLEYMLSMESLIDGGSQQENLRRKFGTGIYVDVISERCFDDYNLSIICNNDTIAPSMDYEESTGGLSPYETRMFIFPRVCFQDQIQFAVSSDSISANVYFNEAELKKIAKLSEYYEE